jgi:hypothetical protein
MKNGCAVCTTLRIFGLIALACASALANASPITIFSSFGPGYTVAGDSLCVYGSSVASSCGGSGTFVWAPAAAFMSTGNYVVSQIDVSLNWFQGTDSATVSLFTDVGNVPGVLLGSWAVSGQQDLPAPPLTTIAGITGITLTNGVSYFLQIAPGGADTKDGWVLGPSVGGVLYDPPCLCSGSIVRLPAFDVLGSAVPEPATAGLIALGLVVVFAALLTRQQ